MKQFKLEPTSNVEITFDEEHHIYLINGEPKCGPNQIMTKVGLGLDFDNMPEIQRENIRLAGLRGKSIHAWTQIIDEGIEDSYEPPQDNIIPHLNGWRKFVEELGVVMLEIEKPHYSENGDFCGIPDRVGLIERTFPYIIDIKSSKTINGNAKLQTMAYKYFFKNLMGRMVVQLTDSGKYKIFDDGKYGKKYLNDEEDRDNWEAILKVYSLVKNK